MSHLNARREGFRMSLLFELAVTVALAIYFLQRRIYLKQRNLQSWESLSEQLQTYTGISESSDFSQLMEDLSSGAQSLFESPGSFRSLWKNLQTARVLMEMADYAERNAVRGSGIAGPVLVRSLRSDAMQIRVSTFAAVAHI
jgi:hypothetical protein